MDRPTVAEVDATFLRLSGKKESSLKWTTYSQIDAAPRKDWLVRDLLGAGELSAWYGAPGCGKSALMNDLAGHVAANRPWFGRAVSGGPVLYIAAERPAGGGRGFSAFSPPHRVAGFCLTIGPGGWGFVAPPPVGTSHNWAGGGR